MSHCYNLRSKRARRDQAASEKESMSFDPDMWLLRTVFSYCDESDRETVFRVSRMWRAHHMWVAPLYSYNRVLLQYNNHTLADQLWSYNMETLRARALPAACQAGKILHVKQMLARDWLGGQDFSVAIRFAAIGNQTAMLELLLQDARFPLSNRDMIALATYGRLEAFRRLCADPRVDLPLFAEAALDRAVDCGHGSLVRFLLPHVTAAVARTEFLYACAGGSTVDVVRQFLDDNRVDPAVDESSALVSACNAGCEDIALLLLDCATVDPSAQNQQALLQAATGGHVQIVKRLLDDQRVVATSEFLRAICRPSRYEIWTAALAHPRVDITIEHCDLLAFACKYRSVACVQMILQSGKIDTTINVNWAPHLAVVEQNLQKLERHLSDRSVNPTVGQCCILDLAYHDALRRHEYSLLARLCDDPRLQKHPRFRWIYRKLRENGKVKRVSST